MTLRELHLFAGAGGGILAGHLLGHRCVGAVEIEQYQRRVLESRQRDGALPHFPLHDDIRTFDGGPWRGRVDVVAGGFPCQDLSAAGSRRGLDGPRSGLWWEMHRVIREVGPAFVFVENSDRLVNAGLDRVLGALAGLGFDAEWCVLSAEACGAPHLRKRTWILAYSDANRRRLEGERLEEHARLESALGDEPHGLRAPGRRDGAPADPRCEMLEEWERAQSQRPHPPVGGRGSPRWWASEPDIRRVVDGLATRVDNRKERLISLGNGQVPAQAATAWTILYRRLMQDQ